MEEDLTGTGHWDSRRRLSPAHHKSRGGLPSPTCGTAGSALPCSDLRQGVMALGWKSAFLQLGLMAWGTQTCRLIGAGVIPHPMGASGTERLE